MSLPLLIYEDLVPTRDYLQDVAKILGKLQQVFLAEQPHEWQKGLQICPDGLMTQPFCMNDDTVQAMLDFELGSLDLNHTSWSLHNCSAQQIWQEIQHYLEAKGVKQTLAEPEWVTNDCQYHQQQALGLSDVLNWVEDQFEKHRREITSGSVSPILLFPHHFDLSLVWFPSADQQLAIGFSTGDQTLAEPYFYITAYPEPASFKDQPLPEPAAWQSVGFSGAVLKYADVRQSSDPANLLAGFWQSLSLNLA